MEKELEMHWTKIKNTKGDKQKVAFITYCLRLIELKELGKLTEEEAAYRIVAAIQFEDLLYSPECDAVFDKAGITELPRAIHSQSVMNKEGKNADQIKEEQWKALITATENAKKVFKIN